MKKTLMIRTLFAALGAFAGLSAALADCVSDAPLCNGVKFAWGCSTSSGPNGPMCCTYETYRCPGGSTWTWREATSFGNCANTPGVPNSYKCPLPASTDPTGAG